MPRAEVDGSDASLDVQINSGDFESTPDALLEHADAVNARIEGVLSEFTGGPREHAPGRSVKAPAPPIR